MKGYWIEFEDGMAGYCEGQNEYDVILIAESLTGKKVKLGEGETRYKCELKSLPYPANPVIWQFKHPVNGECPTFCYSPGSCAGRTSCPKSPACVE